MFNNFQLLPLFQKNKLLLPRLDDAKIQAIQTTFGFLPLPTKITCYVCIQISWNAARQKHPPDSNPSNQLARKFPYFFLCLCQNVCSELRDRVKTFRYKSRGRKIQSDNIFRIHCPAYISLDSFPLISYCCRYLALVFIAEDNHGHDSAFWSCSRLSTESAVRGRCTLSVVKISRTRQKISKFQRRSKIEASEPHITYIKVDFWALKYKKVWSGATLKAIMKLLEEVLILIHSKKFDRYQQIQINTPLLQYTMNQSGKLS